MKLSRPELKRPELRAPALLADLYYDLRDRRLLPLVALVLVATAAVPFLLGGDREEMLEPPVAGGSSAGIAAVGVKGASLTVVEAEPGLRDYRKRLRDRQPTDPFKQQYTGLPKSAQLKSTSTTSSESSTVTVEAESGDGSGSGGGGGSGRGGGGTGSGGDGGNPHHSGVRLYEFVFDVQISHSEPTADGGRKMSEPQVRHGVRSLTQLPGKKTPVVTVGGINFHNGKVFFLVSDEVRSLDGDYACATRAPGGLCELVEIQPGFVLELAYGPDEVAYRIKVTNIDTVPAGRAGNRRSRRARFAGPALGPSPRP